MNPKYHIAKRKYIYDVLKSIFAAFFLATFSIGLLYEQGEEELLELNNQQSLVISIIFLSALIAQLIVYWLILRRYLFSDQEKSFMVERGLFFKRKINIPYKNIHTISLKRRFRDIILGLSTVQFDTGTTNTLGAEAHIVVDKLYAPVLKNFIEQKKNNNPVTLPSPEDFNQMSLENNQYLYEPKWTKLMAMGILKPGFLTFLLAISVFLFGFIMALISFDQDVKQIESFIILVIIYTISILVVSLGMMLYNLIKYYHYRLYIEGDDITYQYGLLNKVEFKLSKKRVNAIHITQSFLYKLKGYYELNVSALGIGDQVNTGEMKIESKSLLPITHIETLNILVDFLGYKQNDNQEEYKPKSFKNLNFLSIPILPMVLISVLPYVIFSFNVFDFIIPIMINIIVFIILTFGLILRLKNHRFTIGDNIYLFQRGAFTIKQTLIKKNRIQMVSYKQHPLLLIEKIGDIKINYKDLGGVIRMNSFEPKDFKKLLINVKS